MLRVFTVLGLSLLVAQTAQAQTAAGGTGGQTPAPAVVRVDIQPITGGQGTAGDATGQQPLTMNGDNMVAQGQEYRSQVEVVKKLIGAQVEQSRQDKDLIRLNCLLDKASQVDVNGKMMDQSLQILREKVSQRDEKGQLHEYTRITIIHQKVEVLRTESDACVGVETNYIGPTKVVVEVPPGLVDWIDQHPGAEPPPWVIERPVTGSPYR
jgi:hypothetical protein